MLKRLGGAESGADTGDSANDDSQTNTEELPENDYDISHGVDTDSIALRKLLNLGAVILSLI